MAGGNRGINMRSTREVIGLIRHLEQQGCRAEWAGASFADGGREGAFPAKVYPPDPSKHFILFHGSVSDSNAATLKRTEIRRAGLHWPGDDGISAKHLRKAGTPGMTTTSTEPTPEIPMSTPSLSTDDRKPGEHLVVPPGARTAKVPSASSRENFTPVLDLLPETFWTDEAWEATRTLGIPGYGTDKGGAGVQRVQGMLDYFGFRVIETRPNRGGFSYRWRLEAEARTDVSNPGANLRAVPPVAEPTAEVVAHTETPSTLGATAGPVAEAMAEAERKRLERLQTHATEKAKRLAERHGEPVQTVVVDEAEASEEQAQITMPGPDENVGEQRDEAAEWRALIEEAEAETARVRAELDSANDAFVRRGEQLAEERRVAQRTLQEAQEEQADLRRRLAATASDRDAQQAATARLQGSLAAATDKIRDLEARPTVAAPVDDGSWVIDPKGLEVTQVGNLVFDAEKIGVRIEIRGHRA